MAKFHINTETVDTPADEREDIFPKGIWEGTVEKMHLREIERGEGGDFFLSDGAQSCLMGKLQIGDIEAMGDGQPNIGAMKYFEDNIFLEEDGVSWDDATDAVLEQQWRLAQTQLRMTRFAKALSLTDVEGDSEGPVDHFDEFLRQTDNETASGLAGSRVRFQVVHKSFKKRDGTDGKSAITKQWYPAA